MNPSETRDRTTTLASEVTNNPGTANSPQHALGNDPDFQELYRSVSRIGATILRTGAKMTTKDKLALVANLKSTDADRARAALNAIGASKQVIEKQRQLLGLVVNRHHLALDPTLPGTFGDAAAAARWTYTDEEGGGPAPDPWDELEDEINVPDSTNSDEDNAGCYNECAALAAYLGGTAIAAYSAALAGCTAAGPFALLCWAGASAVYVAALIGMDAAVDRCVDNCDAEAT
jgi:hypothetical protein